MSCIYLGRYLLLDNATCHGTASSRTHHRPSPANQPASWESSWYESLPLLASHLVCTFLILPSLGTVILPKRTRYLPGRPRDLRWRLKREKKKKASFYRFFLSWLSGHPPASFHYFAFSSEMCSISPGFCSNEVASLSSTTAV
ncbi:hypothetical protein F5Y00DRAFT_18644 [Daldinia vernicosa]|uniref:uncharacterized protein n=1 Tax=Daldinia vernicosa TaxID=114800 RepID=UPI0020088A26|nr:uncharacterized protein F5Y00DRAFT_18644 [Daldinia vernicosa]KAI0851273.1 hypothetical protein F5Y00DRAFT_18644 [Daldinia vernicosa]